MDRGGVGRGRCGAPSEAAAGRGMRRGLPPSLRQLNVGDATSTPRRTGLVPLGRGRGFPLGRGLVPLGRGRGEGDTGGAGTHGLGAPGPADAGRNDSWQLQKVKEICANRLTKIDIAGAIITSVEVNKSKTSTIEYPEILNGSMLCKLDTSGPTKIECSFMVVNSEVSAMEIYDCAISVQHKRYAKAYFCGFLDSLDKYVVCFEQLEPFDAEKDKLNHDDKGRIQKQPKLLWLHNIREVFECLEALNRSGYGHFNLNRASNFVYAANVPPGNIDIGINRLKIINAERFPKGTDENYYNLKRSQGVQFLQFLDACGAAKLTEYKSFRHLVEKSAKIEIILKHPFLLESSTDRVTFIASSNERLFDLSEEERAKVNKLLGKKFPELYWQKTVRENRHMFGTFSTDTSSYGKELCELVRFLRNYIEHERDKNPHRHVNYNNLEKVISELFPCFLSWLYTCVHS